MEEDGSEVDEDEILKFCLEKPLLLLMENDTWNATTPVESTAPNSNTMQLSSSENNFVTFDVQTLEFQSSNDCPSETPSPPTTLSMISVISESEQENSFLSSSIKAKFDSFNIPWNKFSKSVIDVCENKQKLGINLKTVIHVLVDELRTISFYIPVGVFRDVVGKLIAKYPETFSYADTEGRTITIKNSPLITSLIQRNNYLNRPSTSSKANDLSIPLKKKRLSKNFEETCVNWHKLHDSENYEEKEKKLEAKDKLVEFNKQKTWTKDEFEEIKHLMNLLYSEQRKFLNNFENIPSIKEVKENWPFLLHTSFIFQHFEQLVEIDTKQVFEKFDLKIKNIIDFGRTCKVKLISNIFEKCNDNNVLIGLTFISNYFNEKIDSLLQTLPVSTYVPKM